MPKEVKTEEYTTLTGQYLNALMRDYQSGYTVFRIKTKTNGIVTCTGYIVLPTSGAKINVTGCWTDTRYGRQMADCIVQEVLTDREGMLEYLCNIPGIGASIASHLADMYGEKLYDKRAKSTMTRKLP